MDLKEKRGDEFIETIHVLLGLAEPKPDDVSTLGDSASP